MPINLIELEEVDSTNLESRRLVQKGADHGTVVVAHRQTSGRGRLDRKWESPEGGLYATFILKPPDLSDVFSLGISVQETLSKHGVSALLKWPNDLVVNEKKIAGILGEIHASTLILGLGLNMDQNKDELIKTGVGHIATSMVLEIQRASGKGGRIELLNQICRRFFKERSVDKDTVLERWKQRSSTIGKMVQVETQHGEISGRAVDLGPDFELIIKTKTGLEHVVAGDCIHAGIMDDSESSGLL